MNSYDAIAAGIPAEYNPLHTGHLYHLRETGKKAAYTVAVMSGNAVQRGGPAFFPKWERAQAAVLAGVDLVLELPAVWASAPAERFATAAVGILSGCGCVELLSCGSESGGEAALARTAASVSAAERSPLLPRLLSEGMTYAAARNETVRRLAGEEAAALLRDPNNILAVEYLKANAALPRPMAFMTVRRLGAGHDSALPAETASASHIRTLFTLGKTAQGLAFLPDETREIFSRALQNGRGAADPARLDRAILYRLRTSTPEELRTLPDISEGLENRFLRMAETARSVSELLESVKTKRYTMSRLRRILWNLMLGNTRVLTEGTPPYLRVLAFEKTNGRELLRMVKKSGSLPVFHSMAQLERAFPEHAAVEKRATLLYNLCCGEIGQVSEYPKLEPIKRAER